MRTITLTILLATAPPLLVGCATTDFSQSTRLELGDLRDVAGVVMQAFATDPVLAARSPDSPPIAITVGRIENRSSDVITRAEQWYLMQSVAREIADPSGLGAERSMRLVIPAEAAADIRRAGGVYQSFAEDREVTHTLNGRFDSITRVSAGARQDLFVFEYTITELDSGRLLSQHAAEVRKEALGRAFN